MILQRLVEFYDRLVEEPEAAQVLARPGYSLQKVSFCVVLHVDGKFEFQSMLDEGQKKPLPRQMLVPGQAKPTGQGINPCFLWDNAAYMLGCKPVDPKLNREEQERQAKRVQESFAAFRDRHLEAEKEVGGKAFAAVCNFLRGWNPEKAAAHVSAPEKITGSFGVFRLAGEQRFVHNDPAVVDYWLRQTASASEEPSAFCLVSGRREPIARLHEPKIKGVRDTQKAGALLVSFNDAAYESFGKKQGENAPVGTAAAFKYTNALNYLLNRNDRRIFIGDATVVMWAERPVLLEQVLSDLLADVPLPPEDAPVEDRERVAQARLFLTQLRDGHAGSAALSDREDAAGFYILGLSPNASRISIRFWLQSTVGELKHNLQRHMQSLEIVGLSHALTIGGIVHAAARVVKGNADPKSVSTSLMCQMASCVLNGGAYPSHLLSSILFRIKSEGLVSPERAAIIKSYLLKEGKYQMDAYLNSDHPEPSYHCGRLLAVLAFAQEQAQGTVNSGVIRRNLGSVVSSPGLHLGRLQKAAEVAHIPKLEGNLSIFVRDELKSINAAFRDEIPAALTLAEQGLFMLGFYQELRRLEEIGVQVASGRRVRTRQGEWVRSKGEARVAELLSKFGCRYLYEPRAVLKGRERWPDFLVPARLCHDDVYIEYLGFDGEEYDQRWKEKLSAYRDFGVTEQGGAKGRLVVLDARKMERGMPEDTMRDHLRPVLALLLDSNEPTEGVVENE